MITANEAFIVKNSQGFTSPESEYVLQVAVGLPAFNGGSVDITGVAALANTVDEVTTYSQVAIFPVPNTLVYAGGEDIITIASEVAVELLEEWNPGVIFEISNI